MADGKCEIEQSSDGDCGDGKEDFFSEGRIGDLLWEETECTARSRLRIEQIRRLTFSSSLCQNGRRLPISLGKPISIP